MFAAAFPIALRLLLVVAIASSALNACPLFAQSAIQFSDATQASNLHFTHDDGDSKDRGLLPCMMGSGLATGDFDNDGRIDAYMLTGNTLLYGTKIVSSPSVAASECRHQLFRNLGDARFAKVGRASHTDLATFGLGVTAADYDNDGFVDLALANMGSVTLLHNCGDGTFVDCTAASGLRDSGLVFGAGIAFLDIENDGDVDLFAADYVDFDFAKYSRIAASSYPYPPGPEQFEHRADRLFVNLGDGQFEDGSQASGISMLRSPSMGMVCGDFDGDNDTDIFICSDARPNLYLVNDGRGRFTEEAQLQAAAFNANGVPIGAMGSEAADLDNDGAEDLFVTSYTTQLPLVYKNLGTLGFEDIALATRAGKDLVPHANWGVGAADFDNDGDRDLMVANGHLFKWAHDVEQLTDFKVRNMLFANNGKGVFQNVTTQAGDGMAIIESSRGLALDDLDNDGDVDALISNSDAPANVLLNQTQSSQHWVQFHLVGKRFNRDGVGAKVTVTCGTKTQAVELHSGRGYQSHYGTRLHFGIGDARQVDRVQVNWLGKQSTYENLAADRLHVLHESP